MRAGYSMFAVQNGGWCAASATTAKTFDKYGKSAACRSDGEGGPWANQVYVIKAGKPVLEYKSHLCPGSILLANCFCNFTQKIKGNWNQKSSKFRKNRKSNKDFSYYLKTPSNKYRKNSKISKFDKILDLERAKAKKGFEKQIPQK